MSKLTLSLSDNIEDQQTAIFKKCHAFFAFSNSQFAEKKEEQYKGEYTNLGGGLIIPQSFVELYVEEMGGLHFKGIADIQKAFTKKEIIWHALANYEVQITGDVTDAVESLKDYKDITKRDVLNEYVEFYNDCEEKGYL